MFHRLFRALRSCGNISHASTFPRRPDAPTQGTRRVSRLTIKPEKFAGFFEQATKIGETCAQMAIISPGGAPAPVGPAGPPGAWPNLAGGLGAAGPEPACLDPRRRESARPEIRLRSESADESSVPAIRRF